MAHVKNKMRRALKQRPVTRRKKTRVTIDLLPEEHKRLKAIAAIQGTTLQNLIIECIDEKMHKPNAKTMAIIREAEKGKNLVECEDFDDFIKKLGSD